MSREYEVVKSRVTGCLERTISVEVSLSKTALTLTAPDELAGTAVGV